MVAIVVESGKVGFGGVCIAVCRDARVKNTVEGRYEVGGEPGLSEGCKDGSMVSVGTYMGSSYPPDEVCGAAVEVEEGVG